MRRGKANITRTSARWRATVTPRLRKAVVASPAIWLRDRPRGLLRTRNVPSDQAVSRAGPVGFGSPEIVGSRLIRRGRASAPPDMRERRSPSRRPRRVRSADSRDGGTGLEIHFESRQDPFSQPRVRPIPGRAVWTRVRDPGFVRYARSGRQTSVQEIADGPANEGQQGRRRKPRRGVDEEAQSFGQQNCVPASPSDQSAAWTNTDHRRSAVPHGGLIERSVREVELDEARGFIPLHYQPAPARAHLATRPRLIGGRVTRVRQRSNRVPATIFVVL